MPSSPTQCQPHKPTPSSPLLSTPSPNSLTLPHAPPSPDGKRCRALPLAGACRSQSLSSAPLTGARGAAGSMQKQSGPVSRSLSLGPVLGRSAALRSDTVQPYDICLLKLQSAWSAVLSHPPQCPLPGPARRGGKAQPLSIHQGGGPAEALGESGDEPKNLRPPLPLLLPLLLLVRLECPALAWFGESEIHPVLCHCAARGALRSR